MFLAQMAAVELLTATRRNECMGQEMVTEKKEEEVDGQELEIYEQI